MSDPTPLPLRVHPVPGEGAEDVLVLEDGRVLTGTVDGAVHALDPATGSTRRVGHTGGRPLGLELLPDGRVLVCDAHRGLLALDPADGRLEVLVDRVDGEPMRFCNNAAVAQDGTVWFSDSSRLFSIEDWKSDFVQDTRTGRLLRRDPDGTVEVVLDGLAFANGVALLADGSVVVAETGARTLLRVRPGTPGHALLAGDLPGYPDNIATGSDGLLWVTIASPLDPLVERIKRGPMLLRRLTTRIPAPLQPKPQRTVRVQAYDLDGRLVHDLHGDASGFHMATGVREHDGTVWIGSLQEAAVAALTVPAGRSA